MRQHARAIAQLLVLVFLLVVPLTLANAQDSPPFEDPNQPGNQPPFGGSAPPGSDNQQPPANQPPVGQPPTGQEQPAQTPEPAAPAEGEAAPEGEQPTATPEPIVIDPLAGLTSDSRSDLERLADVALSGTRPEGWNGNANAEDPQFALQLRIDLELLAGSILGADNRPPGWFGVVNSTQYAILRDIRHDLELLADTVGTRPEGWIGADPLLRCDRSTQAIVQFLEMNGVFTLQADRNAANFCQLAANEAATFMEVNLLSNPDASPALVIPFAGTASVNTNFAVAFLDRGAAQRLGVIPNGTEITAIGRSPAQFSNMMLVRGADFEVFVDFQFTTVTEDEFDSLPDVDSIEIAPACTAEWCTP